MKLIVSLVIAAALVAGFLLAVEDGSETADDFQIVAESAPTESASADSTTPSRVPDEVLNAASDNESQPIELHVSSNAEEAVEPPKWPDGIESLIFDYFAQLEGFEFTNIASVECEAHTCEIIFSGLNPNPKIVDDYSDTMTGLYRPPINARQGSIGTREIAAVAREFVISISNVPYIEPRVNQ